MFSQNLYFRVELLWSLWTLFILIFLLLSSIYPHETKYRRYLFPGDLRPIRGKYSHHVTSTKHMDQSEKRSHLLPRELTNKNLFLNIRWANKLEAPFNRGLKCVFWRLFPQKWPHKLSSLKSLKIQTPPPLKKIRKCAMKS